MCWQLQLSHLLLQSSSKWSTLTIAIKFSFVRALSKYRMREIFHQRQFRSKSGNLVHARVHFFFPCALWSAWWRLIDQVVRPPNATKMQNSNYQNPRKRWPCPPTKLINVTHTHAFSHTKSRLFRPLDVFNVIFADYTRQHVNIFGDYTMHGPVSADAQKKSDLKRPSQSG